MRLSPGTRNDVRRSAAQELANLLPCGILMLRLTWGIQTRVVMVVLPGVLGSAAQEGGGSPRWNRFVS